MAKQDRKTLKLLRAEYTEQLLGGNKAGASRTLDAIMPSGAARLGIKSFAVISTAMQHKKENYVRNETQRSTEPSGVLARPQ